VRKRYVKVIIVLAAVALLGIAALNFARGRAAGPVNVVSDAAVAVSVEKTVKTDVSSTVALNGKLKPLQEINIIPKMPGKVSSVNYDIGQSVNAGDILFTLEDRDARLQVKQAQAGLDMANSGLAKVTGEAAELQEKQLKAALATAEINYNNAKLSYERTKQLFESGAVSKSGMEQAETQLGLAVQQHDSAKANYELAVTKVNPENAASMQAQVNQAAAALEMAQSQLDNTVVKSPINGVIASRNIEVGELVGSTSIAMSVIDLSSVLIDINATEDMVNKIMLGDKVEAVINAAGDKVLTGEIINIAPAADAKTQSYPVRIRIANEGGLLKGGMFAEIRLTLDKAQNTVAVPISAVLDEGEKRFVYVLKGDSAEKREVSTGLFDDKLIVITKGLSENEAVIVRGQDMIMDGSKVTVTAE